MKYAFRIIIAAILAMPLVCVAHGPSRQKVVEEISVAAPPEKVWEIIADFCAISEWHPAIYACEGEGGNEIGATRTLTVGDADGPRTYEELQKYDAEKMIYKYRITKVDLAVLPVTTYSAFLSLHEDGNGGTTVRWRGGFYRGYPNNDPPPELSDAAAVEAVTAIYTAGLQQIKTLAEN